MGELVQHRNQTIHWKETRGKSGNPFNLKPRPGMLTESGETVLRSFKTTGRYAKNGQQVEWFDVLYFHEFGTGFTVNFGRSKPINSDR